MDSEEKALRERLKVIHTTINEAIKYGFAPLEFSEEELVDISDFFDTFLYS